MVFNFFNNFCKNLECLWMDTQRECVERHNGWKHDLQGSTDWGWLCPGIITYQLCVLEQVTRLAELVFSCVLGHNEVCGRYTWLSMLNPLPSCFLANTATNSLKFWASLQTEQSGPALSLKRKILIRLNTIHHERIVIWNNRFILLFTPFWIWSNSSSCSWKHLNRCK